MLFSLINKSEKPWDKLHGQVFLGGEHFLEKMQGYLKDANRGSEITKKQRQIGRLPLSQLIP